MSTVQEIINLVTPLVPSSKVTTLTDTGSIVWNFNNGNIANLTIAGNRALSMSNVPSNSFGILNLTQGSGGQHILNLPGKSGNTLNFSSSPGDIDLLGFFYDGNNFYWSITNYGNVVTPTVTLATPGNFALAVISANEIDSSWNAVPSASSYFLQRTQDPNYVNGLVTIMSSGSTSFPDTQLSGSTTYYYRVQATAFGFFPSFYATGSATTQASLIPIYLSWVNITGTQLEQFNSNEGVRRQASPNTSSQNYASSSTTFGNGQVLDMTIDSPVSNTWNLWITSASQETINSSILLMSLNGTMQLNSNNGVLGGNGSILTGNSLVSPASGDRYRIQYTDNQLFVTRTTDGANWYTYYICYMTPASSYAVGFRPNTLGLGTSVIFTEAAPLSPVRNFIGITQPGGTQVNLRWSPVVSASNYILQRSVSASFSGSVTLYTGSGLQYQDSGTLNSTAYFYRIQAVGSLNSAWSLSNVVTSTAGDPQYLQFNTSGTKMEPTPSMKGVKMSPVANPNNIAYTYTNYTFTGSQAVVVDIDNVSTDQFSFSLSPNTSSDPRGAMFELDHNGTMNIIEAGSVKLASVPMSIGMQFRISLHTSSFFSVESSSNSGSTWTTFYTSSTSRTGSYYLGIKGITANFGPNNIYSMSISN